MRLDLALSHLFRSYGHLWGSSGGDNSTGVRQRSQWRWTARVTEREGRRSRRKEEKRTETVREEGMQRRGGGGGGGGGWTMSKVGQRSYRCPVLSDREEGKGGVKREEERNWEGVGRWRVKKRMMKTMLRQWATGLEHVHVCNARKRDKVECLQRRKRKISHRAKPELKQWQKGKKGKEKRMREN